MLYLLCCLKITKSTQLSQRLGTLGSKKQYFVSLYLFTRPCTLAVVGLNTPESLWRNLFETVRRALRNRRDDRGTVGSINWLRQGMAERGANPNVVRNIIYRNRGKPEDKRVLYGLLNELWESTGQPPLEAPETQFSKAPDEGELQLLGRDKRRVYNYFVGAVRSGRHPKLLVTGRPGSGKTLLGDALQEAFGNAGQAGLGIEVVRQEFLGVNLADALLRLALTFGTTPEAFAAKLVKVGVAGAYSVQADAQADVARTVLEQLRRRRDPVVLLLHVSQSAGSGQTSTLGDAPLRLNTPDVPRVGLTEWLWHTLLEPLSRLSQVSLLVSMAEVPLTLAGQTGTFAGPVKLSTPTTAEARRFVRTKTPHLLPEQQEALVGQAKRSFEDLRTLTLLAQAREPYLEAQAGAESTTDQPLERLSKLVTGGSGRMRDFLGVLAALSLPEFPGVTQDALEALRRAEPPTLSTLELAFLDAVPGTECWRPFSRQFAQALREVLCAADPERFHRLSRAAGGLYETDARTSPRSDAAARHVYHLFAARAWTELLAWAEHTPLPQPLLQRLWHTARAELGEDPVMLEAAALRVASYYVRLGSPEHPNALGALAVLAASDNAELRNWTRVKRAESALQAGRFSEAETLLDELPEPTGTATTATMSRNLETEVALLRANLARWHSRLSDAAAYAQPSIRALGESLSVPGSRLEPVLAVQVGLWAGLVAKDRGDREEALRRFRGVQTDDKLFRARLRFQEAEVLYRLGRLGEAHTALADAVSWSAEGEAPAFERARYYARRGTLARLWGAFSAASEDFAAAQVILAETGLEPASLRLRFEQAKVQDEAALQLLAEGRPNDAIAALQENLETFAFYGEHYNVDPSFRLLRSRLRLAAAYGCRALGGRYVLPFGPYREDTVSPARSSAMSSAVSPDLRWARQLLREVFDKVSAEPERYTGLVNRARLSASVLLDPAEATAQTKADLTQARYPYDRGLAGAFYASALLRCGDPVGAHAAILDAERELEGVTDDYGLYAYLATLDAAALLSLGQLTEAHERIFNALQNPQLGAYHDALLRRFGETAELSGIPVRTASLGLGAAPLPATLRPADALALRWQQSIGNRAPVTKTDQLSHRHV